MILAFSRRWHLWRYLAVTWLLEKVLAPAVAKLSEIARSAGTSANDQHDRARMRLEVCKRCPAFDAKMKRCRDCGCFMPAKVQLRNAKCPQGRW